MLLPITLSLVTAVSMAVSASGQIRTPTCAIDMGSNTFRRIVGTFDKGRYEERTVEKKTLGVGDDVARHGRISDAKLAEIDAALAGFSAACKRDGAAPLVAVGTFAFRDAPNGGRAKDIAVKHGIAMEIASEKRESELAYLVGSLGQDGYAVIDNGSRSVELVAQQAGALRYSVFNLGYRVAFETFFAKAADPAAAVAAFRDRLTPEAAKAPFMKGRKKLVGVEFGDMIEVLFTPGTIEGRVLSLEELKRRLHQITTSSASEFQTLKQKADIDRALPRLVAAVVLTEAFGYAALELTARELGAGLIIEAGLRQR
jgi:exopolyphosphatase/pppGpp-phosphohydrolase